MRQFIGIIIAIGMLGMFDIGIEVIGMDIAALMKLS